VTLKTVGNSQTITATDTVTGTITGNQSGITVLPGAAKTLSVTGFPDPVIAATPGSVTVSALDAFGNVATGYVGTVHFTSTDAQASLPANYTFTNGTGNDNGTHTFTNGATLKTVGNQSITATDTVTGTITGNQSAITVTPGAAKTLTVAGFPDPVTAGTAGSVTVTAFDASGNVATGYTGTVHFTSTDAQAVLPANFGFTAANAGTHTFTNGATLKTAANSQTITATDTVTGTITGAQTGITVNPGAQTSLVLTNNSGSVTPTCTGPTGNLTTCTSTNESGFTQTVTAQLELTDAFGNVVTNTTGAIMTVNLTKGGSTASTLTPASLTIAKGASTTSGTFTLTRNGGTGSTATMTARSTTFTTWLTLTMSR
jgi:hypothetical protein